MNAIHYVTQEKFMEYLLTWPKEVQEQIPLNDVSIKFFIKPKTHSPVDWPNIVWKKEEIDFNSAWMVKHLSSYSVKVINHMIASYLKNENLVGTDDVIRHDKMGRYLTANGTWPKPPVFAFVVEKSRKTLTVIDGCHRICQMILLHNMLDKMFIIQHKGFVSLQEKHEVWIGSNK